MKIGDSDINSEALVMTNCIVVSVDRNLTQHSIVETKADRADDALARVKSQIDLVWESGRKYEISLLLGKEATVVKEEHQ